MVEWFPSRPGGPGTGAVEANIVGEEGPWGKPARPQGLARGQ